MIKLALISVSDKTGLGSLLEVLGKFRVRIISSGGTFKKIKELGYRGEVTEVSQYTGFPESPGGYVKTLHPKIHGGVLLDRDDPEHAKYMRINGIEHIDLVVLNLYPFEKTISRTGATKEEAFENIDIGGPALVRAAAKGALLHKDVVVITDPSQYPELIEDLESINGKPNADAILCFACAAFKRVREYDVSIHEYLKNTMANLI